MKKAIKQDNIKLQLTHPLADLVEGWFFRCEEISAGYYEIEGIDAVGRVVSASGVDAEKLLKKCITEANSIKAQTKNLSHVLQEPLRGKE